MIDFILGLVFGFLVGVLFGCLLMGWLINRKTRKIWDEVRTIMRRNDKTLDKEIQKGRSR